MPKIYYDDSQNIVLIVNSILLLIYIYQNLIDNKNEISIEFEKNLILFLNYLLDKKFIILYLIIAQHKRNIMKRIEILKME